MAVDAYFFFKASSLSITHHFSWVPPEERAENIDIF